MFPLFLSSLSSPTGYATDGAGYVEHHVEHHVEQKHGFTTALKSQDLNKHNLDSRQTASYMHSM
jgi:iron uptake system EfeUOB component EfeO/EfeM